MSTEQTDSVTGPGDESPADSPDVLGRATAGSAVIELFGDVRSFGRRSIAGSRIVSALRTLRSREGPLRGIAWTDVSLVATAVSTVVTVLLTAVYRSRLLGVTRTVERWIRASLVYRWFVADSGREPTVIDLRDSLAFGPFVTRLDDAVETVLAVGPASKLSRTWCSTVAYLLDAPIHVASLAALAAVTASLIVNLVDGFDPAVGLVLAALAGFALLGLRNDAPWSQLRDTPTVELLGTVFDPPDPPERFDDQIGDRDLDSEERPSRAE